jgi:dihydropyrimidine dehydrogenase (NADP+)
MAQKGMGLACGQTPSFVKSICEWVRAAVKIPFFAKMTPNITSIEAIAKAAYDGGASGVTAINTVSSMQGLSARTASAWPAVGVAQRTTYGGMSGNAVRPIALRAVSSIAKILPGFPILATGGIDSADVGLQFLYSGASALQVCSAIQNQDFTVVQDYISGLKCLLYMQARDDLKKWEGQTPPRELRSKKAGEFLYDDSVPKSRFGPYMSARLVARQQMVAGGNTTDRSPVPPHSVPAPATDATKVPDVASQIGKAVERIGQFYDMTDKEQVVAVIDRDLCISCGKCYMTCNDTGWQAITFDAKTHLPHVTDDCTGCTLCLSVCPIIDCIEMVPKKIPHVVARGLPPGTDWQAMPN